MNGRLPTVCSPFSSKNESAEYELITHHHLGGFEMAPPRWSSNQNETEGRPANPVSGTAQSYLHTEITHSNNKMAITKTVTSFGHNSMHFLNFFSLVEMCTFLRIWWDLYEVTLCKLSLWILTSWLKVVYVDAEKASKVLKVSKIIQPLVQKELACGLAAGRHADEMRTT